MVVFLIFYELIAAVIGFAAFFLSPMSTAVFSLISMLFYCDRNNSVIKDSGSRIVVFTILETFAPWHCIYLPFDNSS